MKNSVDATKVTGINAENFYKRIKMIHDIKLENREKYEYDTGLFDSNGNSIIFHRYIKNPILRV